MTETKPTRLTEADHELVEAARIVLLKHYRPFWHMVAAALRDGQGKIWTGLHLGATVGRLQICAEAVAFGRAVLEGDGMIETVVAVRHPKAEEAEQEVAIVSPCGACREMIMDYSPEAMVIVPGETAPIKMAIRELLILPYRR